MFFLDGAAENVYNEHTGCSYYSDDDTGLYYCNARYYSPKWRRFISPDDTSYLDPKSVNGLNLYCYCGNDPVNYVDPSGHAIETVFDIASLVASVADVIANPANPWAWAGLLGDVIDVAVPFVTGVGEATKAVGSTVRVINGADNVVDAARFFRRTADAADDVRDSVGTYVILYKNADLNYVGKGPFSRAIKSAKNHIVDGGEVLAIIWAPTTCDRTAFIAEYLMQTVRGVGRNGKNTLNLIWSPGKHLF